MFITFFNCFELGTSKKVLGRKAVLKLYISFSYKWFEENDLFRHFI